MFGKINLPCSEKRVAAAIAKYVECEKEVRKHDAERTEDDYLAFTRMSRLLWSDVFTHVDLKVFRGTLLPRHGPGATADRLTGNRKFEQREWTERLEEVFPAREHLIPNERYYAYLDHVDFLEPGRERPVKVITVPKTLKTPRIIAIEPTSMQYMQQAISRELVDTIESGDSRFGWCLGFRDQAPNQRMASEGSYDGSLATLDLSEASDRVSNQLVRRMLAPHKWLAMGVDATRSRKADVPGHGVIRLSKFASMGSALTFPLEAMVFSTLVFLGIERGLNTQFTAKDIRSYRGKVRVYGDDIVVPVESVRSVVDTLEAFGFRVNTDKSFWTGSFRESCGREYYAGHDVSITRVRSLFPSRRSTGAGQSDDWPHRVISTVSLRNRLYMAGLWNTVRYMDDYLDKCLRHFPFVSPGAPVLGKWTFMGYETHKLHSTLHTPLVKGFVIQSRPRVSHLDDVGALLKCLSSSVDEGDLDSYLGFRSSPAFEDASLTFTQRLKRDVVLSALSGSEPAADDDHLVRYGRPDAVDIKLRMASPYPR
nr:MAG: hypothetical protein 3 [Leviviridae sp.]